MSYLGLVSADPPYKMRCRLRRHKRGLFPFQGMLIPWCKTCHAQRLGL